MDADTLRTSLAARLKQRDGANLTKLGEVVETEACWGALVESLEQLCREDADYLVLLDVLIDLGDTRALLLFMSAARIRPQVLRVLMERATELPRALQCALVTLPECEPMLELLSCDACAAAHELVRDERARAKSAAVYASHIGSLRSMKWGKANPAV